MNLIAAQLTPMVAGQSGFGNSIDKTDLQPGTYTLQFGLVGVETTPGTVPPTVFLPAVQAIVSWKVAGQQQRRVISVVSGASISGVCESVDVKIVDQSTGPADLGFKYSVQTTLSKGIRANIEQPPVLFDAVATDVVNFGTLARNIPVDAGVVSLYIYADNLPGGTDRDYQLQMTDPGGLKVFGNVSPATGMWVPIAPGTTQVRVTNRSGATSKLALVWGVEG